MHSIRSRPVCRAHNPFSPSAALWQQFVAPTQSLPRRIPRHSKATQAATARHQRPEHDNEHGAAVLKIRRVNAQARQSSRAGRGESIRQHVSKPYMGYRGEHGQDAGKLLAQTHRAFEANEDYVGVVVQPVSSAPVRESKYPWIVHNRAMVKSGRDRLNLEIQRFHDFILPSKAETIARKHLIEQVRQHVHSTLPDYVLEIFGSQRTGLAFAASDIDMRLVPAHVTSDTTLAKLPPSLEERDRRKADLRKLFRAVGRNYRSDYLLPTLRWARYPLLSLQDRASGLDIQVVLSNDTSVSREYMQRYTQEYPYLPRVYSVLKASLDIRGLSDVFRGGIGSYSLFMMLVASLKHKPHPSNDAAGALENFLKFWAYLKTETHGVSIEPPELFKKSEHVIMHEKVLGDISDGKSAPLPQWMLTIRDPADKTNDLGRKAVAWKHIQATWKSLLTSLIRATEQNTCISLLGALVGPIYTQQQAHRKILAAYGRSLAEAGKRLNTTSQGSPVNVDTSSTVSKDSEVNELAAIAQAVRNGRVVPTYSSCEAEGDEGKGRVHRWLTEDAEVPQHKDTREAFSSMLGLDKQVTTAKQKE